MSVRNYFERILLLSWKLNKTQWNRRWELLWLLFSPTLLSIIAVGMRMGINVSERYNTFYEPIDLEQSWTDLMDTLIQRDLIRANNNRSHNVFVPQLVIAWAPNGYNLFDAIIEKSKPELQRMAFRQFSDCGSLEKAMQEESLFAGICFDHSQFEKGFSMTVAQLDQNELLIPHFNYTIIYPSELRIFNESFIGDNWKTLYHDDPKTSIVRRLNEPHTDGHNCYVREGFLKIQKSISENYLKLVCKPKLPKIVLRRFPVDGRVQDPLLNYINRGLPLLVIIGYMFPAQILVWQIVDEKQRQMRLYLVNMNIGNIIHFIAWFLKGFIYMFISSMFVMMVIKVQWNNDHSLLTQTPWYIVLLVLATYNAAATSFCLMISSFFRNSALSVRILTILWLLTYMPFFVLWNNREKEVRVIRYMSYALPNTLLALIFEGLIEREVIFDKTWIDQGYDLNYAADRINVYNGAYIFFIISVIFCIFSIYMDVWNSGESGGRRRRRIPVPAHSGDFTFQDRDDSFMPQGSQTIGIKATKIYEVEPSHRRFKIKIKKLCKRYSANSRGALNSFTWNVYENEVTVLMGHNGCGKSTLLKILAGMLEPTRGLVLVADYNIQTERQEAAMQLGIALNNNLLLPNFTVSDQIRFICMVKGLSWKAANEEIELYTQRLHLTSLKQSKVKSLASQQRNLLSIACAFAGGSSIILIDDLHCDMDLQTQSLICGLINEEKSRRTIILVSNSTALANHLADRLAIMSNGELKCTGTKPFLRNMYGHGFRLTLVKGKSFNLLELKQLLTKYLPNAAVESNIGYKITFVLENKYEDKFPDLFDELEEEMVNLDIISFRLRDTSLDEIFLRFGSEEGDLTPEPAILIEDYKMIIEESDGTSKATGNKLHGLQLKALLYMRWIFNKRLIPIKIVYVIALVIATAFTFSAVLFYGKNFQLKTLSFNLTQLPYIDAFCETLSDSLEVLEMQEFFTELLFWYDGNVKILETEESADFYLLQQNEFNKIVNYKYMFGASFSTETITVWFNNIPLHAAPFGVNLVHNVVARRYYNEEASIDVTLQPLPFQAQVNTMPQSPLSVGSMMAINYSFTFANMWAGLSISNILERAFKKQQFLAGVKLATYVFAIIIFDLFRIIIISVCLVLMIAIYLSPRHDMSLYGWIFVMLVMSGFSVVAMSYLFYIIFKEPNYAFIALSLFNALGIIIFTITVGDYLTDMNDTYQILSQYGFGEVIYKLFYMYDYNWLCKDPEIHFVSSEVHKCETLPNCCMAYVYTSGPYGAVYDIIMMLLVILVPLILFLLVQHYNLMTSACLHRAIPDKFIPGNKRNKPRQHQGTTNYMIDESVITEQQRIDNLTDRERAKLALVSQGVGKTFNKKRVLIRIDLCIARSDCVGLMGHNNTGKSTFVKLLVGEMNPSYGKLWIGGYNMETQRSKCYPLVGYCPQYECLPSNFTPRELMNIHGQLHGLSPKMSAQICEGLAHILGFFQCYRQMIRVCTTGQHRRISFALALLGDPLLICIDGPPGGIDPNGKRTLYSLTSYMQQRGCSFLYTNLGFLDCERICNRAPILFDGQLWTMGTQAQRYRSGYLLEVRFKRKINVDIGTARNTWDRINQFPVSPHNKFILFMQVKFPDAQLQHPEEESMSFYIPSNTSNFSEIFLVIRKDAFELNIEDFYITRNVATGLHYDLFDRLALKSVKAPTNLLN